MSGQPNQAFEVLDDQGHKTGRIIDRQTVHREQLWHEVVNIWLMNTGGEVLLQLRGPKVDLNPGVWDVAVGTHVRPGEDPVASAQRCLQAELGITITPEQLQHLFNVRSENPVGEGLVHRVVGHVFLLKRDLDLAQCTVNPDTIARLEWRPLMQVMGEVGGIDTAAHYFPRAGDYYPRLFEALQTGA